MFRVLFCDFNAFFASVEQQLDPRLRGVPVGVAPVLTDSSCVIAASYEAKAHGVKTGTGVAEARRLCPGIRIVLSRPEMYVRYHEAAKEAADTVIPITHVHSIDEFSCRLWKGERERHQAEDVAVRLKRALRDRLGDAIRCSIGIAPSRLLAKMASDVRKPDGLTMVDQDEVAAFLATQDLEDVPGIAAKMRARLTAAGITTLTQFVALSDDQAIRVWGSIDGQRFRRRLLGDPRDEDPPTTRRQFGHQHVLAPKMREEPFTRMVAVKLLVRAAERMRGEGYATQRLGVWIGRQGEPGTRAANGSWAVQVKIAPTVDTHSLLESLADIWRHRPEGRVVMVGVVLTDLVAPASRSVPLFGEQRRREKLSDAIDGINRRFGKPGAAGGAGVGPASMLGALEAAPVRISFTQIPSLEDFRRA